MHTRSWRGLRLRCSLLVSSDEPRDTHAIACLLGYGADAICPRLALETVAHMAADDKVGGDRPSPAEAQRRLLAGFEEGVLKVMSKMGISDVSSYRGARLFEAIGLDRTLCAELLGGTPSAIGGARLDRFEREALARLQASRASLVPGSTTRGTSSSGRAESRTPRIRTSSPPYTRRSRARTRSAAHSAGSARICTTGSRRS